MRPKHRSGILLLLPAVLLLCHTALAQERRPLRPADNLEKLMHGEQVVSNDVGTLLNPICRVKEHPWFAIANLRPGRNLKDALEMDFASTASVDLPINVVVNTNGRRLRFPVRSDTLSQRQGVIVCSFDDVEDKSPIGADVEAYLELTDAEPPTLAFRNGASSRTVKFVNPLYFKVSKSITRGNVPTLTYARRLNEPEQLIFDARRKKYGPPPPPPAGSRLANRVTPLVSGTPVLAALMGDWLPAEILSEPSPGQFAVHWPELGHDGNKQLSYSHIAVLDDVRRKLRDNPEAFSPSVRLPHGSLKPPPDEHSLVPDDVRLLPGTPIKMYWGGSLWNYTIVSDGKDMVSVVGDSSAYRETKSRRDQVIVHDDTLALLGRPATEAEFVARLKKLQAAARKRHARSYRIDIPLPEDHVRVRSDTPLKAKMSCKVSWGRKWDTVEVRVVHDDGATVDVYWPSWRHTYTVTRESLIVAQADLKKLSQPDGEPKGDNKPDDGQPVADNNGQNDVEGVSFRLSLQKAPNTKKVRVMKVIMELTGLDLPTAKEVLDNTPIDLKGGLTAAEAATWRKRFEDVGATVSVRTVQRRKAILAE